MDDVAAAFMSAPFQAGGWDAALKGLAGATRSGRMQLLGVGGAHAISFNWTTNCPDHFVEDFVEIGGGDPAMNWRVAAADAPLVVTSERDYARVRQGMDCNVYDDFAAHFDLPFGCQTVLYQDGGMFIGLAALRLRSDGRTSAADRAVFGRAAPHVLAAIRMQKAIEHRGAQLAAGLLASIPSIAFILDSRGKVGALTSSAEDWFLAASALRMSRGSLWARRPDDDRLFQQALGRILGHSEAQPEQFWIGRDDPIRCEMFALPQREWSLGFDPRVLVVVRSPSELDPDAAYMLKSVLHLTSAEADIAIHMGQGQSREAIAKARDASSATVNAQLKSIFRKSGAHREGELVALVNKLLR